MPAMAADGARLLEREGREGLWLIIEDMQRRLSQPPLQVAAKYTKSQVRGSCCYHPSTPCTPEESAKSVQQMSSLAAFVMDTGWRKGLNCSSTHGATPAQQPPQALRSLAEQLLSDTYASCCTRRCWTW